MYIHTCTVYTVQCVILCVYIVHCILACVPTVCVLCSRVVEPEELGGLLPVQCVILCMYIRTYVHTYTHCVLACVPSICVMTYITRGEREVSPYD